MLLVHHVRHDLLQCRALVFLQFPILKKKLKDEDQNQNRHFSSSQELSEKKRRTKISQCLDWM